MLADRLGVIRIVIDEDGRMLEVTGPAREFLGVGSADLLGTEVTRLMPVHIAEDHPGYVARFASTVRSMRRQSRIMGQRRLVRTLDRDGREVAFVLAVRAVSRRRRLRFEGLLLPVPTEGCRPDDIGHDEKAPSLDWRWLRNLGHEVRTPMAAIQGHAEILVDPRSTDEERHSSAEAVFTGCRHLVDLLNDMLDHARLVAGERRLRSGSADVRQVVGEVRDIVQGRVDQKGLELEVHVEPDVPPSLHADSLSLRQILLNLVGNAVKFTEQGFVRIEVQRLGDLLRVDVADTGIGIGAAFAEALFQPFQQELRSVDRTKGSGLGLSISRQLARRMGGQLALVDTSPGVGSRFRLELPLATPMREVEPPRAEHPTALAGVRVIVVDDARDVLRTTELALERAGAEVVACLDAQQALAVLVDGGERFDVAVLDLMMPGMDGYELALALRERGFASPMLALTASADQVTVSRCMRTGFTAVVGKPARRAVLVDAVARALDRTGASAPA